MAKRGFTPPPGAGFTLTEVLLVAGLVALLAALAVPQFRKTAERGYWRSARDILETIYSGEQIYHLKEDQYRALTGTSSNADWQLIYLDNPNAGGVLPVTFAALLSAALEQLTHVWQVGKQEPT